MFKMQTVNQRSLFLKNLEKTFYYKKESSSITSIGVPVPGGG